MILENKSIGVFIDGGYYAKINEGFGGTRKSISRDFSVSSQEESQRMKT